GSCSHRRRAVGGGRHGLRVLRRRRARDDRAGRGGGARDRRRDAGAEDERRDGERGLDLREGRLALVEDDRVDREEAGGRVQDALVDSDQVAQPVEEVGQVVEPALEGEVDGDLLVPVVLHRIVRRDRLELDAGVLGDAAELEHDARDVGRVRHRARELEQVGDPDRRRRRRLADVLGQRDLRVRVVDLPLQVLDVRALRRDQDEPAGDDRDQRRRDDGEDDLDVLRQVKLLVHPVSSGLTPAWIENEITVWLPTSVSALWTSLTSWSAGTTASRPSRRATPSCEYV